MPTGAINYRQHDFVEQLKSQRPVDLVLDMVAGEYINKALKILAMDARIVVIAIQGGRFVEKLGYGTFVGQTRERDSQHAEKPAGRL